jgi:hypothetical protein
MLASLLALVPDPVITGPPPPPPAGAPLGLGLPIVVLTGLAIVWWIARRFTKAGTLRAARIGAFGAAIGNALMDLAAIMQPDRPSVVEIQRASDEGRRRTDAGDGDESPAIHPGMYTTTPPGPSVTLPLKSSAEIPQL